MVIAEKGYGTVWRVFLYAEVKGEALRIVGLAGWLHQIPQSGDSTFRRQRVEQEAKAQHRPGKWAYVQQRGKF